MSSVIVAARLRHHRGPAAACGLGAALPALVGLALSLNRPHFDNLVTGHELGDVAMAVACGLVAVLILSRRAWHPVGELFAAIGIADGLSSLSSGILDVLPVDHPGYRWGVWFSAWTWVPGLMLTVAVLPLMFPEGVVGRVRRILLRVDVALIAVVCLSQALSPRLQSGPHSSIDNPVGIAGIGAVGDAALGLALAAAVVSLVLLVVRLVRADDRLRRQMLPLVAGGVIVVATVSSAGYFGTTGVVLQDVSFLLIPAAALLSVLGLRLYDLELAIGRSAGWVLLSALLIAAYVVVVELCATWLHVHGRAASVIATATIALAFGPLRALLQRWIARWLYGDRGDPYAALTHTTQVLSAGADPLGALHQAATDLAHRLRSPGVRIIRGGAVLVGPPNDAAVLAVPLLSGGVEVGRLEILPRTPGEAFSRMDERLILDLCPPLTNAVAAIGLADELHISQERLALIREAERRRVRGELHDDVGPSLAAAAVQAQTMKRRLERGDIAGAAQVLTTLQTTITHAASDLRSAIDALGPRALEEVGLVEAVRALATTGDGEVPRVEVAVGTLKPMAAGVEVAVYRVIAEALTNARKHARANHVVIRLCATRDRVEVSVRDDGVGLAPGPHGGVGIASMRARIVELSGDFAIGAGASNVGTTVRASVPIPTVREPSAS